MLNWEDQSGLALIMMLLMVLMTSVIMMALNLTGIDSNLALTNRRTTQGFHASESGSEIGIIVLQDTVLQNVIPTYPNSGVVVNPVNTNGTPFPDFIREMTSGIGSSADSASVNPNVTITSLTGQTLQVDIDYEGPVTSPGGELDEFGIAHHKKTAGTGCNSGTLYYIDSVASGSMNTQANVLSAYYQCS
jgi:hypothetical protein